MTSPDTPSPAQDTNEFVANAKTALQFDLTTMSSLAPVAGQLTMGGPPECAQRPFCLPGLKRVYGIVFQDFDPLDVGGPQTVAALRADAVQIGLLFSTDPSITRNGFVPLVDDKHLQNAENITPVIRSDKLNDKVRRLLDAVSARLSTQNVTELVGEVVFSEWTSDGLREALERRLPGYMVPRQIFRRIAMPFGANGKLNRAALLRELEQAAHASAAE